MFPPPIPKSSLITPPCHHLNVIIHIPALTSSFISPPQRHHSYPRLNILPSILCIIIPGYIKLNHAYVYCPNTPI